MAKVADKYFLTDEWKVIEKGFDKGYSRVSESIFTLSNETLGIRGNFDEGGSVDTLRGAYVNGVYELDNDLPRSYKGIVDKTHFMIPSADWLHMSIMLDDECLDLGKVKFSDFSRELNMHEGTLVRKFIWHTKSGKDLQLTFLRFVDMTFGERAYQRVSFLPLNFSGEIKISTGISFDIKHEGRNTCFWQDARIAAEKNAFAIQSSTLTSKQEVFAAAHVTLPSDGTVVQHSKSVSIESVIHLTQNEPVHIDKRAVILFDHSSGERLWQSGQLALQGAEKISFDDALTAHKTYWKNYWQISDITIEAATEKDSAAVAEEQQGIRFCNFQMAQTYKGGNIRHNIGAKGLTGEAYNGHAFWDTEACCLPFYLFNNPEAAKSLLTFRYNTLPHAIARGKMLDCEGACYPIATLNGDEACNLWQHASIQYHPSSAVAYGIWHYVHLTGDTAFLWEYGAEMLLEIARFMASRAGQHPRTGKWGYYGVMGPDEFHMMVNNNAYTNYMGKRTLEYALEVLGAFKVEKTEMYNTLIKKTNLALTELDKWQEIASHMAIPMTEGGLIEQHDGYFDLPYIDVNAIPIEEFPLYNHWSYDRIYRTTMIKQPDVLMFLFLYNSSFSTEIKRTNYEYYEPLTIHESSLSPAIHSILAAELGLVDEATKFFGYASRLDLDNYNRNTNEGLHTTSIAMVWMNIAYGFAGLRSDDTLLKFAPVLPARWKNLKFSLTWQGRIIELDIHQHQTTFTLRQGNPMDFITYDKPVTLGEVPLTIQKP
ncbi:MAG: family 65 glycosyl hydrolase [Defluviitaleaceae bacterium]|nr:family 65 glycosyl hydrolase [Defluviitaleaceae bacterium]